MICVVTGASSGIGRAAASSLAQRGVSLVLSGRDAGRLDDARNLCAGVETVALAGDVTSPAHTERLFEIAAELGPSDKLAAVFAAGVAHSGDTLQLPEQIWHESISANLTGLFLCCRSAISAMLVRGGGHIVNVMSIASITAFPQSAAYVASKQGALGLTRSLAAEFRARSVQLTAFMPGSTDTELWEGKAWSPPKDNMLSAADVGDAIADLVVSDRKGYMDEVHYMPPKGIL
ncbi:MAG: SDR family oxidoreductase [Armatimonadetes bacterium]|nr:SDR family oxidoreductase [Armatimonadota bacterium]